MCNLHTTLTLGPAGEVRWGRGGMVRTTFPDHFSVCLFDFANENYINSISIVMYKINYLCVPPGLGVVQIPDHPLTNSCRTENCSLTVVKHWDVGPRPLFDPPPLS